MSYVPLATITLNSSAASITFSNINQSYKDLVVIYEGTASDGNDIFLYCNGNKGNDYGFTRLLGDGGQMYYQAKNNNALEIGITYNLLSALKIEILDYSDTSKYKQILSRSDNENNIAIYGASFKSTAAVTSVELEPGPDFFNSGSVFSLYGIEG